MPEEVLSDDGKKEVLAKVLDFYVAGRDIHHDGRSIFCWRSYVAVLCDGKRKYRWTVSPKDDIIEINDAFQKYEGHFASFLQ
jgi:hypothetical protein